MHTVADRLEFAPPPTAGLLRSLGLAVIAHALLVAALTWGVHWKRNASIVTAEAELWSALPRQAAPKLVEALPAPPPPQPAPPAPATPKAVEPDIALEREKARQKKEKQLAAQLLEQDRRAQQKLALEKQRAQEEKKRAQDEKLAQDKKKSELEAKRKELLLAQQEASRLEAQRRANIQRMAGLALGTGAPTASGTAQQSSGPSASYASRVSARVKPNIVFTEDPAGNPTAIVEVRAAPDGTIVSRKLLKSSGTRSWDDAVLKAIDKTEMLPRDVDGRVPPILEISFRPRD